MSNATASGRPARRTVPLLAMVVALVAALFMGLAADGDAKKAKKPKLKTMTMNVYLGADLTPILEANNVNDAVDAGGEIANQVDRTNFPLRAQALAQEILSTRPDLVGLQEVALWRTQPVNVAAINTPSASEVEYNFLQLLLGELNKSGNNYEAVVVKQEFDAEFPVNDDTSDGQSGLAGADHNQRLTMHDVILRRVDSKAKVSNPNSGTFATLLRVSVAQGAATFDVTRGWTAVDVKLKGTKKFRFVNTHLEAFDSSGQNPTNTGQSLGRGQIRAAQASELVGAGGPANTPGTDILVGDINSDDDTVQPNGDRDAYNVLLAAGLLERTTANPLSCCLDDPNLVQPGGFDHQVDHIMTDNKKVKLKRSTVLGLNPVNGLFPSDHAAVFSKLQMPPKGKNKK
jgi:endonuclease/exonuclease/phosphatase family metal-dependent hydrolase